LRPFTVTTADKVPLRASFKPCNVKLSDVLDTAPRVFALIVPVIGDSRILVDTLDEERYTQICLACRPKFVPAICRCALVDASFDDATTGVTVGTGMGLTSFPMTTGAPELPFVVWPMTTLRSPFCAFWVLLTSTKRVVSVAETG
jgi:hypothetical protein